MRRRIRQALQVMRLAPWLYGFGMAKHFVPLPALARLAYRTPLRRMPPSAINQIASSVLLTGRMVGMPDRDCVQRSLLLYRELSAAGLRPLLSFGFTQHERRLSGHAWVSVGGAIVGEPDLDSSSFTRVATFGTYGALVNPADGPSGVAV